MQKKLTITVDEAVYNGLHKTIGPRKISKFIEELVRPHVVRPNLEKGKGVKSAFDLWLSGSLGSGLGN